MAIDKIGSASIGTDVIVAEDLAANSVTVSEIQDSAVTTVKISDDAVTGAKIEDNPTIAGNLTVVGSTNVDTLNVSDTVKIAQGTDVWVGWDNSDTARNLRIQTNVGDGSTDAYGVEDINYATVFTNEQGTTNQAIVINDKASNSLDAEPALLFSVTDNGTADATTGTGSETWTKLWSVSGTGIVQAPKQPCFTGYVENAFLNNANTNSGDVILFGESTNTSSWTQDVDSNGDFNANNGRFTAPVDGNYYFSAHMTIDAGDGSEQNNNQVALFKNGSLQRGLYQDMESTAAAVSGDVHLPQVTSIAMVITLTAGDYVQCGVYENPTTDITNAIFSGFLIG
jgi:hypothetical protein